MYILGDCPQCGERSLGITGRNKYICCQCDYRYPADNTYYDDEEEDEDEDEDEDEE